MFVCLCFKSVDWPTKSSQVRLKKGVVKLTLSEELSAISQNRPKKCFTSLYSFIITVWTSDKDNRRVSFGYHDALVHPQSKTDQPVCPRTESDWNDLNDRHSSKPVSRMLDDAYVLKNPEFGSR